MTSPKRDFGPTFSEMASGTERKRPPISARVRRAIELMTFGLDAARTLGFFNCSRRPVRVIFASAAASRMSSTRAPQHASR
jgi:hypothetical protein